MPRTIFTTPIVNTLLRAFSVGFLRFAGWKVEGSLPTDGRKSVLIAAPHTSNWDLPYTLMVSFVLGLNVCWLGKAQIFRPPFRGLMIWLGGIPVRREKSNNLVEMSAAAIKAADHPLQLIVPPEGTRGRTRYWKTGFWYIARTAEVPIVMAYMDYERKISGLGPVFHPTGDVEADMVVIKGFYAQFKGRNSDQFDSA